MSGALVGKVGGDEVVIGATDNSAGIGDAMREVHDAAGVHIDTARVLDEEARIGQRIEKALKELTPWNGDKLLNKRYDKFIDMGRAA